MLCENDIMKKDTHLYICEGKSEEHAALWDSPLMLAQHVTLTVLLYCTWSVCSQGGEG